MKCLQCEEREKGLRSMATRIETIEAAADTLILTSIGIEAKRCSYIRNWNSTCRACLDVCMHDAIKRSVGRISIDSEKCTECGACVSACPTSTFVTTSPTYGQIVAAARERASGLEGNAVFACTRQIDTLRIDATHLVELPCLDYLDEYLIIGLFATDEVDNVVIFSGSCEGCDKDCAEPWAHTVIRSAKRLMKLWGITNHVKAYKNIPEAFILPEGKKQKQRSLPGDRREAFADASQSAKAAIYNAASDFMSDTLGTPKRKVEDPNRQIIVRLEETYPPESYRPIRMLRMLDHLGERPYGQEVESRFWTSVANDPKRCRHCGACATMCVTGALTFEEEEIDGEKPGKKDKRVTLTFRPALCVGCRLCKDGCLTRSMLYENKVAADDLDDDVVRYLLKNATPDKRKKYF